MRRSITLALAILMVLALLPAACFTVGAEKAAKLDFGFAGTQIGDGALRLIGYTDSLAYDSIGFIVTVGGDADKEKELTTDTVFSSLNGNDGVVAATKASGVEAPVTVHHDYLYGYAILGITDGEYVFSVVPTATKGEETVKGNTALMNVTVEGGEVSVKYLEPVQIEVDPATASYDLNNQEHGEGPAGIFDGSLNTKLCCSVNESNWPLTISWELDAPQVLVAYEIVSGNDHPGRDPKDWVLYGSNDGENWTALDEQTDNQFAGNDTNDNRVTPFMFEMANVKAYQYYKWVVSNNNGYPHFQLMELNLYGLGEKTNFEEQITVDSFDASENVKGVAARLFDGDLSEGSKVCEIGQTQWWVSAKLPYATAINRYKLGTGNDQAARDPKEWKVYGSNDGENWTELDHRTNQNTPDRSALYTYTFENEVDYGYYKLEIIANRGTDDWGYDISQVSDWQLFVAEGAVADEKPTTVETEVKFDTATIQGSIGVDGGEGLIQLFDGNVGTKACAAYTTTLWVSAKTTEAAVVNMYKLASANDHPARDPKTWVLYGSNDGENWVELDSRDNNSFDARNTEYTFTFENTTAYSYYTLDILSNNGKDGVGIDCVQFSEWQLFTVTEA